LRRLIYLAIIDQYLITSIVVLIVIYTVLSGEIHLKEKVFGSFTRRAHFKKRQEVELVFCFDSPTNPQEWTNYHNDLHL